MGKRYSGKEYGLHQIGVTYGYAPEGELEEAGAEYIAESVEDLGLFLLEGKM
ncbi:MULTISPECIES: hypothetical protein [Eisenbergiella]|uniref:hypothetical protein n=1 Tax=Eisenbergiella TaxID=1432051 RepID=UPI0018A6BB5A|nr:MULTISPECIES: hypothetical protein [Eisenbergiella]MCI6709686.1 hypothetical protein [Eisenbergiella massiliensis]MDY2653665.1 hypothetical protein [Eisenbergiella porci]MDY5528863.1 hypothetical protein [Eisenbergiella porci]